MTPVRSSSLSLSRFASRLSSYSILPVPLHFMESSHPLSSPFTVLSSFLPLRCTCKTHHYPTVMFLAQALVVPAPCHAMPLKLHVVLLTICLL